MTARKTLTLVARITVSAAMLGYLAYKINSTSHPHGGGSQQPILPTWSAHTASWLALALAITFFGTIVCSFRWRAVLQGLEVTPLPPSKRLVEHYLAGHFVGNVLPSTVGGDVLRVSRLSKDTNEGPISFASVVLERLTGWLVLPVLILVGFAINRGLLKLGRATHVALVIAAITLVMLVLVLLALSSRHLGGRLGHTQGWRRFAAAVHLATAHLRHHPVRALTIIGWGFAYQVTMVLAAYCAARTLGVSAVGPTALLTFYPAVLIVQVLPISIAGFGIREGLFVLFLHPLGVPDGKAVALGILIYLLALVVSLFGAPAFAFGNRRDADAARAAGTQAGAEQHADAEAETFADHPTGAAPRGGRGARPAAAR